MNTGCETRISEQLGDLTGAADTGRANPALVSAHSPARRKRARLEQELRPASTFVVHARLAGRTNHTAGASHWNARHSDDVVEHAVALHAAGTPARQIARELKVARRTVRDWLQGRRRRPPDKRSNTRRPLGFTLKPLIGLADLPTHRSASGANASTGEARPPTDGKTYAQTYADPSSGNRTSALAPHDAEPVTAPSSEPLPQEAP